MSFKVSGNLQKTYIPSIGGYKYSVGNQAKYFNSPEEASNYANKIMDLTGTVLSVTETKKWSFNRKICIF